MLRTPAAAGHIAQPLALLVDGNNLAHFLYTNLTPGQKMTQADSQRLIAHLGAYARTYPRQIEVELCLDRSPGPYDPPPANLRVQFAEYPQTGDDLLLGRFWFHHFSGTACLVITNDEAILEEVGEAGGISLRVYDFVRRPGLVSPVFRAPEELPVVTVPVVKASETGHPLSLSASIYFRIAEDRAIQETQPAKPEVCPRAKKLPEAKALPVDPPVKAIQPDLAADEEPPLDIPLAEDTGETHIIAAEDEGPYYFLNLDAWPLAEGARFLLNAFCMHHRAQYGDLMDLFAPDTVRAADLRALAEFLLHTCGDEPGFAQRGALMARVRLALLQARGEPLSLAELSDRTGLKQTGLRGRIKQKAAPWVEILTP